MFMWTFYKMCAYIVTLQHHTYYRYLRKKRKIWVKPGRADQWWKNLETDKMCPDDWNKKFVNAER